MGRLDLGGFDLRAAQHDCVQRLLPEGTEDVVFSEDGEAEAPGVEC